MIVNFRYHSEIANFRYHSEIANFRYHREFSLCSENSAIAKILL